jgi:VWFA-related protein
VLVPVVVRDAAGNAVGNLRQEDFQLFDKGKLQVISKFSVEDTSGQVAPDRSADATAEPPGGRDTKAAGSAEDGAMAIPNHFVALLFDDLHLKNSGMDPPPGYQGDSGDLMFVRKSALKFLDTLKPADRVAIFTTSGAVSIDFTLDRAKLKDAVSKLQAGRPVLANVAGSKLTERETWNDTLTVMLVCKDVVLRMNRLPGQRTLVFVSPGLSFPVEFEPDTRELIDGAIRSRVVINSLDARGLAVTNEIESRGFHGFQAQITDGTGGRFISNSNDLDDSIRRLAATPRYIYVLGFSPPALKQDGSFHLLTVKVRGGQKLGLQARKGYWAPDANELARAQNKAIPANQAGVPQVDESQTREVAAALGIRTAVAPALTVSDATVVANPSTTNAHTKAAANDEIITRDEPLTFKAQTNLVQVPVIVRDREGHAVGNLSKDDFRLTDKGKRQDIARFEVQTATSTVAGESSTTLPVVSGGENGPAGLANRFIVFVFDDLHVRFENLPQVRDAVRRYLRSSFQPNDRAALYTTSGKVAVDFTDQGAKLDETLLKIAPSPLTAPVSCASVSYFQAVQIDQQVSLRPTYPGDLVRSVPLRVAFDDTLRCMHFSDGKLSDEAAMQAAGDPSTNSKLAQSPSGQTIFELAVQEARDAFLNGRQESRANLSTLSNIVRRMALLPGQRRIVLASPGFFVPADLQQQGSDLIALAIRSKVLISTVDARGVWTNPVFDASWSGPPAPPEEATFKSLEGNAVADELLALAEGTGGTANMSNDFDAGVRKAAAAPEYLYVLGFVPQNLKADGSFHPLKVTLAPGQQGSLQVRRGYYAPRQADDEVTVSKQQLEDAVFSRDEIHNLPVELHTQVTKTGDETKLKVLTDVDLKLIHLRKADERNRNDLTIIAALFDPNGNFIGATQQTLLLRLRDETVVGLEQRPPVTITTNFAVKPGAYLVRLVVRDAEGQQLTAENGAVQVLQ